MSKIVKTAVYLGRDTMTVFNGELDIVVSYGETVHFTDATVYDDLVARFPDSFEESAGGAGTPGKDGADGNDGKDANASLRWFGLGWVSGGSTLRIGDMSGVLLAQFGAIKWAKFNKYDGHIYAIENGGQYQVNGDWVSTVDGRLIRIAKNMTREVVKEFSGPVGNISFSKDYIFAYIPSQSRVETIALLDYSAKPNINQNAACIVYDALENKYYGANNGAVFSVDPETGATTAVVTLSGGNIGVSRGGDICDRMLWIGSGASLYKVSLQTNAQAGFISPSIDTIFEIVCHKGTQAIIVRGTSSCNRYKMDNAITSLGVVSNSGSYSHPFGMVYLEDRDVLFYNKGGTAGCYYPRTATTGNITDIGLSFSEVVF